MGTKLEGMMTKVWGPTGWLFLHSITFGYPHIIDEENEDHIYRRESMKVFFESMRGVLPCNLCRDSFSQYLHNSPIDKHLNRRIDLIRWLYDVHNLVNNKLGVPECDIPSFKDFVRFYENFRAACKPTSNKEKEERVLGCKFPKKGYKKKRCVMNIVDNDNLVCDFCKKDTDDIKFFTGEKLCGKCRGVKNNLLKKH